MVIGFKGSVAPLHVYTERELSNELQSVVTGLQNESNWKQRMEALTKLQGLLTGGAGDMPSFAGSVVTFRNPLLKAAVDRRSTLAKAACHCIADLAATLRHDFDSHAHMFVKGLLKLTYVTISVISTAGDRCIRTIIVNAGNGFHRTMEVLLEQFRGRNSVLRAHCMEYILLALHLWETDVLERSLGTLTSAIQSGVTDSVAEVRSGARLAYWAFEAHFAAEGARLLDGMDASTQRLVLQDEQRAIVRPTYLPAQITHCPVHSPIAPFLPQQCALPFSVSCSVAERCSAESS